MNKEVMRHPTKILGSLRCGKSDVEVEKKGLREEVDILKQELDSNKRDAQQEVKTLRRQVGDAEIDRKR